MSMDGIHPYIVYRLNQVNFMLNDKSCSSDEFIDNERAFLLNDENKNKEILVSSF